MIHGLADNPYVFDDLAPAFTKGYRVIAYGRRGSGSSDMKGPYDIGTLAEDLHGLMDALRIDRADLVGYSADSDEITEMAARYPDRVSRIVYFEGGYDWAGRDFATLGKALPVGFFDPPRSAMASIDAFRAYQKMQMYPALDDIGRIDANLRQNVVIQSDGTLKYRIPKATVDALYSSIWANKQRDYTRVRCPALALCSDHLYDLDLTDGRRRSDLIAYEQKYWIRSRTSRGIACGISSQICRSFRCRARIPASS